MHPDPYKPFTNSIDPARITWNARLSIAGATGTLHAPSRGNMRNRCEGNHPRPFFDCIRQGPQMEACVNTVEGVIDEDKAGL
jgi:hypothetical protein